MPRFAFRQVDVRDVAMFLANGEVRSKNHAQPQACHQTSYPNLVGLRGTHAFPLPHGGVVNDYVAFYFSPVTAFTYTIHKGNVEVISPTGTHLGRSSANERVFLVVPVNDVYAAGLQACFSDNALNSQVPAPSLAHNLQDLETHVQWRLFDDTPKTGAIPEIGYGGVCQYFLSAVPKYHARSPARMAELLVKDAVPTDLVACIVTPNPQAQAYVRQIANQHGFTKPVTCNPGCFI